MAVCTEAESLFLVVRDDSGLAKLGKYMPRCTKKRDEYEWPAHIEYMVDLQPGKELWTQGAGTNHRENPAPYEKYYKFGWDIIYEMLLFREDGEPPAPGEGTLGMSDIRTGTYHGCITIPTGNEDIELEDIAELRIVRLNGEEVIVTLHTDVIGYKDNFNSEIRFTKTTGETMSSFGPNLAEGQALTRTRIMTSETCRVLPRARQPGPHLADNALGDCDIDLLGAEYSHIEFDLFRGFLVAIHETTETADRKGVSRG
ncbi:hypothetical protein BDW74DRAFT_178056 [Aspergillus multicolor]|uniref:uncharacterized protein n=1 Tax=Aspergillus multicolor TaxID=41759 RepID=UPI003CCE3E14